MKETCGENFPGLDMLTNLLTPRGATSINKTLIEEVLGMLRNILFQ